MPTTSATIAGVAAASVTLALAGGIGLSAAESHHHRHGHAVPALVSRTDAQRLAVAQQMNDMPLPAGVEHTSVCPQPAIPTGACFKTGASITAVTSPVFAQLVTGLQVAVVSKRCGAAKGAARSGDGIVCLALGTWDGAPVTVFAFSPTAAARAAGAEPGTSLIISAVKALPR